MAFLSRVGGLLKKTYGRSVVSGFSAANAPIFQSVRWMSSSKLFVGGLSYSTDEMSLKETFSQYGDVVEARVVLDRDTGRSRGFAFITYTSTEDASSAIQALDGKEMHGRQIRVNYATEKPRSTGFGYGGQAPNYNQGGGGGYGSGSGGYGGRGDGFGQWNGGGYNGGNQYRGGDTGYAGGNNSANPGGFGNDNYNSGYGDSNNVARGGGTGNFNLESTLDGVHSNTGDFTGNQSRFDSSYGTQEPLNVQDSNTNDRF